MMNLDRCKMLPGMTAGAAMLALIRGGVIKNCNAQAPNCPG
jgi:hypothetical protein